MRERGVRARATLLLSWQFCPRSRGVQATLRPLSPFNGGGVRSGAGECERLGIGPHCFPGNFARDRVGSKPHCTPFNGGGVRSGAVECESAGLGPHCFPGNFASDRVGSKPHCTPFNSGGAVFHAAAPVVSPPPARWNSEASSRRSQQSPGQGPSCTGRGRGGEVANHCPPPSEIAHRLAFELAF
jgi:hypothetical protein